MSLHPEALPPVPESTATLARTVFRKGNRYMLIRDELGVFYKDQDFAALYPTRGQAAETPWRLALILVFQFMEGLSDREAAEAVFYALCPERQYRSTIFDPKQKPGAWASG